MSEERNGSNGSGGPGGPRHGVNMGGMFGDIRALSKPDDTDSEAEEQREREKFNEFSICGRIARNKYFEYVTLGVIVFNALYLGYDCDYNARWKKPEDLYASDLWGFILLDNFFCVFFTAEVVIRFLGYKSYMVAFKDLAFLFDLFLVVMMVGETWVLVFVGGAGAMKQVSILRLLRLTRLLRMGKLLRYFPELQLIVKGMLAAVRSVGCATILLLLVLYVFSIIFTDQFHQGLKADDAEDIEPIEVLFGTMGKSMRHLLIMATFLDDITACTNTIRGTGKLSMLMVFMACVLVSSFTLFNMLLGILCEVVGETQNGEQAKQEEENLNSTMMGFFKTMDLDQSGSISRFEFMSMQHHAEIMEALEKLNIQQADFEKYAELLFTPATEGDREPVLSYADVVSMIMRLRPGQHVNCCNFTHFKIDMLRTNMDICSYLERIEELLDDAGCDEYEDDGQDQRHGAQADDEYVRCSAVERLVDDYEESPYYDGGAPQNGRSRSKEIVERGINNAQYEGNAFVDNAVQNCGSDSAGRQHVASSKNAVAVRLPGSTATRPMVPVRQHPTIASLASSHQPFVAEAPPVVSRFVEPYHESSGGISPHSSPKSGQRQEDGVTDRLNRLAEKRRSMSTHMRSQMYNTGGKIYYHRPSTPPIPALRNASHANGDDTFLH